MTEQGHGVKANKKSKKPRKKVIIKGSGKDPMEAFRKLLQFCDPYTNNDFTSTVATSRSVPPDLLSPVIEDKPVNKNAIIDDKTPVKTEVPAIQGKQEKKIGQRRSEIPELKPTHAEPKLLGQRYVQIIAFVLLVLLGNLFAFQKLKHMDSNVVPSQIISIREKPINIVSYESEEEQEMSEESIGANPREPQGEASDTDVTDMEDAKTEPINTDEIETDHAEAEETEPNSGDAETETAEIEETVTHSVGSDEIEIDGDAEIEEESTEL